MESASPKKLVLIVDDNAELAAALAQLVKYAGCTAVIATNGADALTRLHEHEISLILLDGHMPGMSGFDVMDRLADRVAPPIAVFSADAGLREEAIRRGAVAFLSKTEMDSVVELVARHC